VMNGTTLWNSLAVAALLGGTACRSLAPGPPHGAGPPAKPEARLRLFQVTGTVQEVRSDSHGVVIRHEQIPGYLAAMTMPFEVKDPKLGNPLPCMRRRPSFASA